MALKWDVHDVLLVTTIYDSHDENDTGILLTQSLTSPLKKTMYNGSLSPSTSSPPSILWPSAFLLWRYLLSWQLTPGPWAMWMYKCCWWATSERLFVLYLFIFSFTASANMKLISIIFWHFSYLACLNKQLPCQSFKCKSDYWFKKHCRARI